MVYVLITPNFEYIKIGKSTSFKQRLSNIQSGCPFELDLWLSIRTPKADEIESLLHKRLRHINLRGEWFKPQTSHLDELSEFFRSTNANVKEVAHALL